MAPPASDCTDALLPVPVWNTDMACTSCAACERRLSATAALCSTRAAFCWVAWSICVMASPTWPTPVLCFAAGGADLAHDIGYAADGLHHFGHGGTGAVHQGRARFHPFHAGANEGLDFLGGFGAAPGQAAHFTGHHGKTPALFARRAASTAALSARMLV